MRKIFMAMIGLWIVVPAMAQDAPKLPDGAKELNGADITALYDGSMVKWVNFAASFAAMRLPSGSKHRPAGKATRRCGC
jgi:hypothetical protein